MWPLSKALPLLRRLPHPENALQVDMLYGGEHAEEGAAGNVIFSHNYTQLVSRHVQYYKRPLHTKQNHSA